MHVFTEGLLSYWYWKQLLMTSFMVLLWLVSTASVGLIDKTSAGGKVLQLMKTKGQQTDDDWGAWSGQIIGHGC